MQKNKQVVISLQGALENGEVFEETPADHPLPINLEQCNLFPKLIEALEEMLPKETRSILLEPEEAYGPYHEDLVQTYDRSAFGDNIEPKAGMVLSITLDKDGTRKKVPATVIDTGGGRVTVDYNHPLAGKKVVYTITFHHYLE